MKQQQLLILEGPDMVGKTEISKEVSKRWNVPRFKASNEHQSFLHEEGSFLNHLRYADPRVVDMLKQTGHSVIFDRAYPSEWVYSRVLGRKTDDKMLQFVDESFAALGTFIVICRRSTYEGIVDDVDPQRLNTETIKKIDRTYLEFSRWTRCKTFMLNVDDQDLDREVDDIEFMLKVSQ